MTDKLTVRLYNVRFGDAVLITVPDRDPKTKKVTTRRILIDVGNVKAGEGGDDKVFKPVLESILNRLGGEPLDLYVMTHEHMDHVQGLPYAAWKVFPAGQLAKRLAPRHVWLTASAAPDYYDKHPQAKKQKLEADRQLQRIALYLQTRAPALQPLYASYIANNDPQATAPCVEFLRQLNPEHTTYVYRGMEMKGTHSFKEAKLDVWAPEEDTSEYYGRFEPLFLEDGDGPADVASTAGTPRAPPGVDLGAFLNLLEARRAGMSDNLLNIDQSANNTSIVFSLEWRGWRLLFPGDAEIRSWKTMRREGVLKPVHFLKVAHHGSHNGTPDGELFDAILPAHAPDDRPPTAAISTWHSTYPGIPHPATNQRLATRCALKSILDDEAQEHIEISFEG